MMTSLSNVLIFIVLVSSICNTLAWNDCGNAFNSEVPRFTQFALFPNPVQVGEIVHARAVVSLPAIGAGGVTDGSMKLIFKLNGEHSVTIPQISLCNSTTAIACGTLKAGDNAFSFDFKLPQIPAGTYSVQLFVTPISSQTGCLSFDLKVTDPESQSVYTSWVEATLAGVAQFTADDIQKREYGDLIQVGPIGPVNRIIANSYQWGTFINVIGSQDVLGADFAPVGYVWGLYGNMTELQYNSGFKEKQTYTGTFYIGYVSSLTKRTLDTEIAEGDFKLTWTFRKESNGALTSTLVGTIYFDPAPRVPKGWSAPVTLDRLGPYSLHTNDAGMIMVQATKKYCLTAEPCDFEGQGAAPGNEGLSDNDIAIMVALLVGIPLIAAMVGATLLFLRHRKRNEEEAGIFSAARKPEYGNALVIDDIIQESREQNGSVLSPRSRRSGDSYDYSDDDEDESTELNSPRSNPSRRAKSPVYSDDDDFDGRSPGRSTSRSRGKATRSETNSDYSD